MEEDSYLKLATILKQNHLAKKINYYLGNFEDIKNLALSNMVFYDTLKKKNFCLCLNIPYSSDDVEFESDFDKEEIVKSTIESLPWINKSLDLPISPSLITELEIPFIECIEEVSPIILSTDIQFPNLRTFTWYYNFFTSNNDLNIMVEENYKLIAHVLGGIQCSKNLKCFCFHFPQIIISGKSINNKEFYEYLIKMMTKHVSNDVRKIEFGNFEIFTKSMADYICKHFKDLSQFILYKVNIMNDVSFEDFNKLNYLYIPCFEGNIRISSNLKVLIVRCSNYEARIDYEEGDNIDFTDIEYPCNCRTVGQNFSYCINHNVGISLHRLTIYFNNPILYDFYRYNLPDKMEMYIPNFNYTGSYGTRRCYKGYYPAM
uniref:ORFan n=1 Tax=Strongyloides papillosus TaxID=174720 RepID=A0A0N5C254_STREA